MRNRLPLNLALLLLLGFLAILGGQVNAALAAEELFLPVSTPGEQGLDESALHSLANRASQGDFGALHSLIVIRHDHIVFERYFWNHSRDKLHRLYSVTKSIASTLIGIAIDKGLIKDVNQTLLSFFPEYPEIANPAGWKQLITLRDVLTMRAGFQWDEWATPYSDPGNPTNQLVASPDWIKFMLDLPMAYQPGTVFTYNSGGSILLSGILKNKTGMTARKFAEQELFGPLGITSYSWLEGPHGISNTGWGLSMRSIDMAKIGYLYLKGGLWRGRQILSLSYISQATHNFVGSPGYGFQWWLQPQTSLANHSPLSNDIWSANGSAGQYIFVVPLSDMVVVMSAENGASQEAINRQVNEILPAILQAVRD